MTLIKCPDCGRNVSSEAAACPGCARPIHGPHPAPIPAQNGNPSQQPKQQGLSGGQIVIGLLAVIAALLYFAVNFDDGSASSNSTVGEVPATASVVPEPLAMPASPSTPTDANAGRKEKMPVLRETPSDLYQMYSANEVAADSQFKGHIIEVTASVDSIDMDANDSVVLHFSTGDEMNDFEATLLDSEKTKAEALSKGQLVTLRCQSMRRFLGSPMGDNCVLQ